jgi:7-carboxy-7-deazaguanine synthase
LKADHLRVSEIYTSIQGEGPATGSLTQFVRFAGCNMRCPGWPCDTEFAIDPKIYMHDGTTRLWSIDEIVDTVSQRARAGATNICLTGGEPMLQGGEKLAELVTELKGGRFDLTVEMFSNGSFDFDDWPHWAIQLNHIMMDWKLSGSGEGGTELETRMNNALLLRPRDGIKFVLKTATDWAEVENLIPALRAQGVNAVFWLGEAWPEPGTGFVTDGLIALAESLSAHGPIKINTQVHKYLWDPNKRGV